MTIAALSGFSAAMFVLAASPGPGVLAVISQSLSSGLRKSLYIVAGIVTGDLLYLIFALTGLTYIARNMDFLFLLIRLAGGFYLILMGLRAVFGKESSDSEESRTSGKGSPSRIYLSGLTVTLSNPKAILFYCGFLPAFTDLTGLTFRDGFIISVLITLILGSVMIFYAFLAASAGQRLSSPKGKKWLNRGAGSIMTLAGTMLIVKK